MLFIHFLTDVIYIFTSHMAEVDVATLWYDCTCRQSWFLMRRTRAKNRNLFGSASPGSPANCPTSDLQESAGDGCPASSPAGGSFRRTTERLKLLKSCQEDCFLWRWKPLQLRQRLYLQPDTRRIGRQCIKLRHRKPVLHIVCFSL